LKSYGNIVDALNGITTLREQDPSIFSGVKILPDVRDVLLRIADDIEDDIRINEKINIHFDTVVVTGSLTGYDYDEQSDIDLHFIINKAEQGYDVALLTGFLKYYSRSFNQQEFDLVSHKVEIYFQDSNEPHESPGVYDLRKDSWVRVPTIGDGEKPSDVMIDKYVQKVGKKIGELEKEFSITSKEALEIFYEKVLKYKDHLRAMRGEGLSVEGINSIQNLVFKRLRRNGMLQRLSDLDHQIQDDIYEV